MTQVLTGYRELHPPPDAELIETDGVPLDSDWHRLNMDLLCDVVSYHLRDREDFYVGGNMFIYFQPQTAPQPRFPRSRFLLRQG
jgi:hypothetical protein